MRLWKWNLWPKQKVNNGKEDSNDMNSFYINDNIFNVQPCRSTSSMLSALKGNYGEKTYYIKGNLLIELIKNNKWQSQNY